MALQEDYSYYSKLSTGLYDDLFLTQNTAANDGVYGGFNNITFDHETIRLRVLRGENGKLSANKTVNGFHMIAIVVDEADEEETAILSCSI